MIAQCLAREHRRLDVQRPLLRRVLALGKTSAELSEKLAPLRAPGVAEETTA